jgi:RNA-directed DNA polymerase
LRTGRWGYDQRLDNGSRVSGDVQARFCEGPRGQFPRSTHLVVFCESREDAEEAKVTLSEWLSKRGLSLSQEKTRIAHLTEGFDFLGFNIRHYKTQQKSGYKLLITPSKKSVEAIRRKLREKWLQVRGANVTTVLIRLNPIIRGWANYFRIGVARATFHTLDHWMYLREVRYAKWIHPHKPEYWRRERYWGRINMRRKDNWVFGDKRTGKSLLKFTWFRIQRHVMLRGSHSPDDPRLKEYWLERNKAQAKDLPTKGQVIAERQNGLCDACGESLFNGEELHTHHVTPKKDGGRDTLKSLKLIHLYCHQQLHTHEKKNVM